MKQPTHHHIANGHTGILPAGRNKNSDANLLGAAPVCARLICVGFVIAALAGCTASHSPVTRSAPETHALTPAGATATDPYFTTDHQGNPVLCWTEQLPGSEDYLLKYAVFDPSSGSFGSAVAVTPSAGTKTTAESANKVAFKKDGTVVALFGKRFDDPVNRFAGAIQYSVSTDDGQSWSAPKYLHSDTLHQYGRSFFDMATLGNGEVAAVWLDGRYGDADTGSALFFASTMPGAGFGMDKQIGESTCECCRTDLMVDSAGTLHIAYRDILYPPSRFGKQVRDMVYISSRDTGRTFSAPVRISADNWEIEGCPHSGPSLAVASGGLEAVWFTAGPGTGRDAAPDPGNGGDPGDAAFARGTSAPGIYRAILPMPVMTAQEQAECLAEAPSRALLKERSVKGDQGFSIRELVDSSGRHPQLISLPGGGTAVVMEQGKNMHGGDAKGAAHTHHGAATGASAIEIRFNLPGKEQTLIRLTDGTQSAHHAVLAVTTARSSAAPSFGTLLAAWVEEENGVPGIRYCMTSW